MAKMQIGRKPIREKVNQLARYRQSGPVPKAQRTGCKSVREGQKYIDQRGNKFVVLTVDKFVHFEATEGNGCGEIPVADFVRQYRRV
jgi:hypothetical protein